MPFSMTRVCMYRTRLPEGDDGFELVEAVRAAGARVMGLNQRVVSVDAYTDIGGLVTLVGYKQRDQWLIRRQAPHVAVAILVQAGVDVAATKLVDVVKPEHVPPRP
mgnify:CR=1 FL=1